MRRKCFTMPRLLKLRRSKIVYNVYVILKTMCSPSSHHNVFVATHSLGRMTYSFTLLVRMNKRLLNKLSELIYSYNHIFKSRRCPQSGSAALILLNPIHEKGPKSLLSTCVYLLVCIFLSICEYLFVSLNNYVCVYYVSGFLN